jgi:signal transduction histidine kinase
MDDNHDFRLVRYFAMFAAPLLAGCVIAATITHRSAMMDDVKEMGEQVNITLGQTLLNTYAKDLKSVQAFSLDPWVIENRPAWMINDLLDKPVSEFLSKTSILGIKIFTVDGKSVYFSHQQEGAAQESFEQDALIAVNENRTLSHMRRNPNFSAAGKSTKSRMIINTFMPIMDNDNKQVLGALELYGDISQPYNEVQNGVTVFFGVLFALSLLFFYTMIFFMKKAEVIIERQHDTVKRDHEYLKLAFDKAKESDQAKSAFLASMSHELRTPLNAIIGYSELLMDEPSVAGSSEQLHDLNNIKSAGSHLKTLIEEILDHAKIESGMIDVQTNDCDLEEMITSCVAYITPEARSQSNNISIDIDKDIQAINTDEVKIKRIVLNLLSNANKFTKEGKIAVSAHLDKDNFIVLRVSDTGLGIPSDQKERIFEAFTQADNSYTRQHGGTGLGLTISREYAKSLGGNLGIVDHQGVGTIMEVKFPYCPAQESNGGQENIKHMSAR